MAFATNRRRIFGLLTVSGVLGVGGSAATATAAVGARRVQRVAALIREVALFAIWSWATTSSGSSPVPDSDLPELLIDLEALQAQLLHLLQERTAANLLLGNDVGKPGRQLKEIRFHAKKTQS